MANKKEFKFAWALPLIPVLAGLFLLLSNSVGLQTLRNNLFDQYQRWRPRVYVDAPVRIVDIDDESLAKLGQWPWPRTRLAELVDRLTASGAAAIGFDVVFAEPDRTSPEYAIPLWGLRGRLRSDLLGIPSHDKIFADHLSRADAVLGFALDRDASKQANAADTRFPAHMAHFVFSGDPPDKWLHRFDRVVTAMPSLAASAKGNGALTFVQDNDGVVRRVPLVLKAGDQAIPTLTSEVLRVGQGAGNIIVKNGSNDSGLTEVRIGQLTVPTTSHGEVWVHYTATPVPNRYISAWKVLAGQVPQELLDGNLILVGSSAQGLMDLRFNPLGRIMPGVEAHAQTLEQVLSGHYLERPAWATALESAVLVIAGLGVGFVALRARVLISASVAVALIAIILGAGWYAFAGQGFLLDSATPSLVVVAAFVMASAFRHFLSEREQKWIRDAFSHYVSPNRVSYLVEHPEAMELGGRRQECSFIFTDLAGFTTLMEKIDPADAVSLLNTYLDGMIAIAFRHEGTLDRIMGDALSLLFSAPVIQPDHRARALACALELDEFASQYSKDLQQKGVAFGKTRIGVHSGEVIVGNFGGSNMFDYRALGDPINTASRLESVNKHLGTRMCVSEATLAGCDNPHVRPVGRLVLKGKTEALGVFEPITEDSVARAPLEEYVNAYIAMKNNEERAEQMFQALVRQYPEDPLVVLHSQRLSKGERGDRMVMLEK